MSGKLTNARLLELCEKYPPPQSWYDEDHSGLLGEKLTGNEKWSPHVCCPECASFQVQRTGIFDGETEVVYARCECGWRGEVDELIEGESN